MRYNEDREKSAEIMRQALPLMSKQTAGFHPVSYTIWYEYVADINAALRRDIDARLATGALLADADVDRLFEKHIAQREADFVDTIETSVQRVLQEVRESTVVLDTRAANYNQSLEHCQSSMATSVDESTLRKVVTQLLLETKYMQASAEELRLRLDASQQEIAGLREQLEQTRSLALRDSLTGLHNRRAFEQALRETIASEELVRSGFVLLLADIDNFKRINDTYGHVLGDKVICAVAQAITLNIKGGDLASRYGGEEFAILLRGTSVRDGANLAEKIRGAVAAGKIQRPGHTQALDRVTISMGVTQGVPGESFEALIARVDGALYASKQGGRDRISIS